MEQAEYIIAGSGLTGAVIARCLQDAGRDVLVLEKRAHLAGLCYDEVHQSSGLRYHVYGPHAFRTRSDEMWAWLNAMVPFYPFKLHIRTLIDGQLQHWPPHRAAITQICGSNTGPGFSGRPANFEEATLAKMPSRIYEKFVRPYTEKQWGMPADQLWIELAGRFGIKEDNEDDYLFDLPYQGLPQIGFSGLITELLRDIPVRLNRPFEYDKDKALFKQKLVYTGPIDAFFNYQFGKLAYRGMKHQLVYEQDGASLKQAAPIYNYPSQQPDYIRSIDWQHWQPPNAVMDTQQSLISYGYPVAPNSSEEYAYPVLTSDNLQRLQLYKQCAAENDRLIFCGRLADYKYYDMNHAIARGLEVARQILKTDFKGPLVEPGKE